MLLAVGSGKTGTELRRDNSALGSLCQVIRVLLEWRLHEMSWLPEVRSQIAVSVAQSLEASLHEVTLGFGVTT